MFEICKKSLRLPAAQKRTVNVHGAEGQRNVYTGGENTGKVKRD